MIFNKDGNGSDELYKLSGTFQASTDFNAIVSEIESAQAEVSDIVGREVVNEAETVYAKENPTAEETSFLQAVQRAVAFLAISRYARLTGLSHGDTGRKIKTDENEKIPFEWMIDRDDREMRERWYRAMDALFSMLEASASGKSWEEAWKKSDARNLALSLIVKNLREVERVYPLERSRYTFHLLAPVIREVQDTRLRDIIGAERLQQLIDGSEAVANIRSQAIRFTVLLAVATAVKRWSLEVFPLSVARRFSPSYQGNRESAQASVAEMEWFIDKLELQANGAALEIKTAISGNPYEGFELIPENSPSNKYFTT